jgi:hypothetical protein
VTAGVHNPIYVDTATNVIELATAKNGNRRSCDKLPERLLHRIGERGVLWMADDGRERAIVVEKNRYPPASRDVLNVIER